MLLTGLQKRLLAASVLLPLMHLAADIILGEPDESVFRMADEYYAGEARNNISNIFGKNATFVVVNSTVLGYSVGALLAGGIFDRSLHAQLSRVGPRVSRRRRDNQRQHQEGRRDSLGRFGSSLQ